MREPPVIQATRRWVERVVVGLNLCPFAAVPVRAGRLRYTLCEASHPDAIYLALLQEMETLISLSEAEAESGLLVTPRGLADFGDYLDLFQVAEAAMAQAGLEGILQLASFHPDYCFEGAERDDPANYTNRSPYPMFHLIREEPLARALERYPNPEGIPERNIALLRQLGLEAVREHLAACIDHREG
jgi:uncharacterized protein